MTDRVEGLGDERSGAGDEGPGRVFGQEGLVLGHRRCGVVILLQLDGAQEEVGRVVVGFEVAIVCG